jgi:hypothetical protein
VIFIGKWWNSPLDEAGTRRRDQCCAVNANQDPAEQIPEQHHRAGPPCIERIIKRMMGFKNFRRGASSCPASRPRT